jgi:hypothetical protein
LQAAAAVVLAQRALQEEILPAAQEVLVLVHLLPAHPLLIVAVVVEQDKTQVVQVGQAAAAAETAGTAQPTPAAAEEEAMDWADQAL